MQFHRCEIAIVGGSIIGSAVAYFLLREGKGGRVTVIEPDPSYEFAAAPRASGNVASFEGYRHGMKVPIVAMQRMKFYFESPN